MTVIPKWSVILCDRNENQVRAWRQAVDVMTPRERYVVKVVHGEIFSNDTKADAIVSPANSFGFMDGGIDLVYTNRFGPKMQADLQSVIKKDFDGELLVGQAAVIPLDDPDFKVLVSAPTMRVPARILDYTDVYLATRAAMKAAIGIPTSFSILFPGMGTGVGGVYPDNAAQLMLKGIDDAFYPRPFPDSLGAATGAQNNSLADSYRKMIGR